MCHASEPFYERVYWPPKGVMLETDHQIVSRAKAIIMQSSLSHAMPPANVSYMEPDERRMLLNWYRDGIKRTHVTETSSTRLPSEADLRHVLLTFVPIQCAGKAPFKGLDLALRKG